MMTQKQLHKAACFVTLNLGGSASGGRVLHDNDNDNDDMYMTPLGRIDLQSLGLKMKIFSIICTVLQ